MVIGYDWVGDRGAAVIIRGIQGFVFAVGFIVEKAGSDSDRFDELAVAVVVAASRIPLRRNGCCYPPNFGNPDRHVDQALLALKKGSRLIKYSRKSKPITLPVQSLKCKLQFSLLIDCGSTHAALTTRQGEVFTWGEESGGRLGHGTEADTTRPNLVDTVTFCDVDAIACGEYHTCASSSAGTYSLGGDGTYTVGLLGHGAAVSHWIPKRVSGTLEGVQILPVARGTRHSALTNLNRNVFTFGDGSFGGLGHGDRESVACPREVESLGELRALRVACGVWHTAAIVKVLGQPGVNAISRILFAWGDGDKYRLGHGDKEAHLVPTYIPSLIEYNFHQMACRHNMTVVLTASGHVSTWGSIDYGQVGNPHTNGKMPCVVQDRLSSELGEEISCGAYHVTAQTARSEVFLHGEVVLMEDWDMEMTRIERYQLL